MAGYPSKMVGEHSWRDGQPRRFGSAAAVGPGTTGACRRGAALLLAAFALRCWDFGNSVIHVDEQWYLLVGDGVLRGAVPYVDLWDRKPAGLFLLFAAIRLLPGDGVLAYQLVATMFAAATAIVIERGARRIGAAPRGAIAAGLLYLLGLELLGGRGGQAPVFYDLPVALAGLIVLRLRDRRHVVGSGAVACLVAGLAIQLKGTVAIEGAFIGLAHAWTLARRGARPVRLAAAAVLWLLIGLGPTLAVAGWYARHGWSSQWWFANVTSIALRPGYPVGQLSMRLLGIAALLSPMMACAALTWRTRAGETGASTRLAFGWLFAATVGFASIGTFFDHYALPLLAPLAICAAPTLGRLRRVATAIIGVALLLITVERASAPDDASGARRVAAVVRANTRGGCPYVFAGDTITYLLARACTPTAYAFPNLLAYTPERGATGVDEAAEVRRILFRRPPVIVGTTRRLAIWNPASLWAVRIALAADYRPVFSTPRAGWRTVVWLRRDLAYRAP